MACIVEVCLRIHSLPQSWKAIHVHFFQMFQFYFATVISLIGLTATSAPLHHTELYVPTCLSSASDTFH
jgi:hypothetical protein